ncbi:TetR/AcrR family transcriptional regulator [uncultured Williamsia sp.]|uniref:TetR/AcrR family transcriptional regulator n=1 Tax=uncultured Williamsia sp. TaxID=259311 RepID=UPI002622E2CC|nr:TetR/AcrR family transcriptional regulator [uncultured Williamsia sp.]
MTTVDSRSATTPSADTSSKPLRADAERNRLRILDAARELFAQRGPDVTLDDIAAHAGVGVGTVYRRFANRDELLEAIVTEHFGHVQTRVQKALDADDAWEGIVDLVTFVSESMATDRGLAAVMLRVDPCAASVEAAKQSLTSSVDAVFERGRVTGVLREDIAESDFFAIFCMLRSIADLTEASVPGTWRRYLSLLLDSIRADGTRMPLTVPALTKEQIHAAKHGARGDCSGR